MLEKEEEERLLFRWIEHEDKKALRTVLDNNVDFLYYISLKSGFDHFSKEEKVSIGTVAIGNWLHRWNPKKGAIRTFMRVCIVQALRDETRKLKGRGLTGGRHSSSGEVYYEEVRKERGRNVLGEHYEFSKGAMFIKPKYLESGKQAEFLGRIDDIDDKIDLDRATKALWRAVERLDVRERDIVVKRKLSKDPMTLNQVGALYGLTRERIRQIEEIALDKVRRDLKSFGIRGI